MGIYSRRFSVVAAAARPISSDLPSQHRDVYPTTPYSIIVLYLARIWTNNAFGIPLILLSCAWIPSSSVPSRLKDNIRVNLTDHCILLKMVIWKLWRWRLVARTGVRRAALTDFILAVCTGNSDLGASMTRLNTRSIFLDARWWRYYMTCLGFHGLWGWVVIVFL